MPHAEQAAAGRSQILGLALPNFQPQRFGMFGEEDREGYPAVHETRLRRNSTRPVDGFKYNDGNGLRSPKAWR